MEILDSRGRPTVKAYLSLSNGVHVAASVPSGASTGKAEAFELRDGDPKRYQGLGCLQAVSHINETIAQHLTGQAIMSQAMLDQKLIDLDGSPQKSRLGANAILAISLAYARALAAHEGLPLWKSLRKFMPDQDNSLLLPRLTVNLFSGGKHAGGQVPIQDVLLVPVSARSIGESLQHVQEVYRKAVDYMSTKYKQRWLTADEGGLAPPFEAPEQMFEDAVAVIKQAGFEPGVEMGLALDVAASHFYKDGHYQIAGQRLTGEQMVETLKDWVNAYPILSLEDGLAEDDWKHWPELLKAISDQSLVLGDDLLCTNPERIKRAISSQAANALLLKVNQIGTLTEAAEAFQLARQAGWQVTVSARSGETEDNWLADLVVAWSGHQLKVGSITQSERLSKYNRLMEIETETKWSMRNWEFPTV